MSRLLLSIHDLRSRLTKATNRLLDAVADRTFHCMERNVGDGTVLIVIAMIGGPLAFIISCCGALDHELTTIGECIKRCDKCEADSEIINRVCHCETETGWERPEETRCPNPI